MTWAQVLDDFGAHLALQADLLDRGRYDELRAFDVPTDLGPMPDHLEPRARALVEQARDIVNRVTSARDRCGRQVAYVRRMAARSPAPRYVDQSA